jgi:hypothetical protein
MTVTDKEKREIIRQHEEQKKRELSERMAELGRSRSPAKRKAVQKNVKIAQAARFGRPRPKT